MEKTYTLEEYYKLKQKVLNLRQSAVELQGTGAHARIWDELRVLEEELANAKITHINDNNMHEKFQEYHMSNMNINRKHR